MATIQRIALLPIVLVIGSCCMFGKDLNGPGLFMDFRDSLRVAETPDDERAAIDRWAGDLAGEHSGVAFADSYEVHYEDRAGRAIAISNIPRWLRQHANEPLFAVISYHRGTVWEYRHKLIDRENWWRFMLGE